MKDIVSYMGRSYSEHNAEASLVGAAEFPFRGWAKASDNDAPLFANHVLSLLGD